MALDLKYLETEVHLSYKMQNSDNTSQETDLTYINKKIFECG
jgi:hypothetical protein